LFSPYEVDNGAWKIRPFHASALSLQTPVEGVERSLKTVGSRSKKSSEISAKMACFREGSAAVSSGQQRLEANPC